MVIAGFKNVFKEIIPKFILMEEETKFTDKETQKSFKDNSIH